MAFIAIRIAKGVDAFADSSFRREQLVQMLLESSYSASHHSKCTARNVVTRLYSMRHVVAYSFTIRCGEFIMHADLAPVEGKKIHVESSKDLLMPGD